MGRRSTTSVTEGGGTRFRTLWAMNIILTGQITECQRDAQTREVKCIVASVTLDGSPAEAAVKVGFSGKLIVINAYVC